MNEPLLKEEVETFGFLREEKKETTKEVSSKVSLIVTIIVAIIVVAFVGRSLYAFYIGFAHFDANPLHVTHPDYHKKNN